MEAQRSIAAVQFSPDGKYIIVVGTDNQHTLVCCIPWCIYVACTACILHAWCMVRVNVGCCMVWHWDGMLLYVLFPVRLGWRLLTTNNYCWISYYQTFGIGAINSCKNDNIIIMNYSRRSGIGAEAGGCFQARARTASRRRFPNQTAAHPPTLGRRPVAPSTARLP